MTQESAVSNGVFGGQRRQRPSALDDCPQDQAFGLRAVARWVAADLCSDSQAFTAW